MAGWFNGLVESLKEGDLKSAVDKAADGIANLGDQVKETLREKAAEVEAESEVIRAEKERMGEVRALPWECREEQSIMADDLMEKILSLGLDEANFKQEPTPPTFFDFEMERHVEVITRLLELDPNLSKVHYRLSAKMDERVFWRNYFHRCALLRAQVGVGEPLRRKVSGCAQPRAGGAGAGKHAGAGATAGGAAAALAGGAAAAPAAGSASGPGSSGSEGSSGPYAGSEGEVVDLDSTSDLAALDAEVNAELGDEEFNEDDLLDLDDGELDAELEAEIAAELDAE